ncbi:nucleoside permease [Amorphoplanes digitatis]|uniref:Nucleoside transporter n=1 Tax=Actinoplanes digitatis TaxID=1868 RepID=A0A7W7HVU0_9ACTN|nr:nucleoside permease [Actinoplanes digitatis]MBB4761606.1 nucleoside transporter [Actinoplanes digitatis]BFE70167.1 nucleoside permease [Actinoplanes digitatis]GID90716.1 MFS transporter [Actinoplanes digitatis]
MTATTGQSPGAMNMVTRLKLSSMMFLQFFVWGAWFVTMGTFLDGSLEASGSQISLAYLTQSLGAIAAPFFIGLIADQFFSAQKVLGILHIAGAVLLFWASTLSTFSAFFPVILAYMILYMPTLALVNSVSFRQMTNPERQFPAVRVLGTIGWIVAGVIIGWLAWEQNETLSLTFRMAAIASLILGVFSFVLPATPPIRSGGKSTIRDILGLDALALLKNRSYLVFFLSSIAICIPLAFYYNFTNLFLNEAGVRSAAAVQSLGQASEVLFLLLMPFLLIRLGVKITLAIGMAAWALRYVFFAFGDAGGLYWMLLLGILLHGICYDFFFVAGQIYTDKFAGERFRSAAQGMITLATYGVGILIGSLAAGPIVDNFATADGHDWTQIWIIPAVIAAVVLVLFLLLFKDRGTVGHPTLLDASRTTLEAPGTTVAPEGLPRHRSP